MVVMVLLALTQGLIVAACIHGHLCLQRAGPGNLELLLGSRSLNALFPSPRWATAGNAEGRALGDSRSLLPRQVEEQRERYMDSYDIVLEKDETLDVVNGLLQHILQQRDWTEMQGS